MSITTIVNFTKNCASRSLRDTAYYVLFTGALFFLYLVGRGDAMSRQMMLYVSGERPEILRFVMYGWVAQQLAINAVMVWVFDFLFRISLGQLKWLFPTYWAYLEDVLYDQTKTTMGADHGR